MVCRAAGPPKKIFEGAEAGANVEAVDLCVALTSKPSTQA
jgi:hypothetical protein